MIHDTFQPYVAPISYGAALGQSAAAQVSADGTTLVVRYVNAWNTSVEVSVALDGFTPTSPPNVTQLKPPPDAMALLEPGAGCEPCTGSFYAPAAPPVPLCCSNPPGKPELVVPQLLPPLESATKFSAPPFSYTVAVYSGHRSQPEHTAATN